MEEVKDLLNSCKMSEFLDELVGQAKDEQMLIINICRSSTESDNFPDSLTRFDFCRNFVWEKLHTGHWKDVDPLWLKLFSLLNVLKLRTIVNFKGFEAQNKDLIQDMIKICDVAILMGAPILQNLSSRSADVLSRYHNSLNLGNKRPKLDLIHSALPLPQISQVDQELECLAELSLTDFIQNYKLLKKPVKLSGIMTFWPAMESWNVDYFLSSHIGLRSVPVELGSRYTDDDWTQTIMTLREFVQNYILSQGKTKGYLAQHQLFDQIPELLDDIETPEYCYTGPENDSIDINSWFGPSGTVSPLHNDPRHNFLCQVFGSKYIKLYEEKESGFLSAFPGNELLSNTSQIDLEDTKVFETFPDFKFAKGYNCHLKEGEVVYIPPKCWHFVKSLAPSFSVSFWFS